MEKNQFMFYVLAAHVLFTCVCCTGALNGIMPAVATYIVAAVLVSPAFLLAFLFIQFLRVPSAQAASPSGKKAKSRTTPQMQPPPFHSPDISLQH